MAQPMTTMLVDGGGDSTSTTTATSATDSALETTLGIAPILLTDASKYKDGLLKIKKLYDAKDFAGAKAELEKFFLSNKLTVGGLDRYTLSLKNTDAYKEALREWSIPLRKELARNNLELTDKELEDYFLQGTSNTIIYEDAYKKILGTGVGPE